MDEISTQTEQVGARPASRLKILARDFTRQTHCTYCPRPLTSGTGYIMADPDKGRVAAGPRCAARRGDRALGYVDYVAGMQGDETGPDPRWPVTPNSRTARKRLQTSDEQLVRDYLTLRYEKLGHGWFPKHVSNPSMRRIHAAIKAGSATPAHYAEARERLRSEDLTTGLTSPAHLLRCYQAKRQIEQCLARNSPEKERLERAAAFLRKHLSLHVAMAKLLDDETKRLSPHLARLPLDAFKDSEAARIAEIRARPNHRVPPPKSFDDYRQPSRPFGPPEP